MKRVDLLNALKATLPAVDKKDTLSGQDSFLLEPHYVRTYSTNLSVSYPFETGIDCTVRAEEFFKVLSKMEGEEVTLTKEEGKVKVTDGKTRLTMRTLTDDRPLKEMLTSLSLEKCRYQDVPETFMDGLKFCSFSVSRDPLLSFLNGIYVDKDELLSSDNIRISSFLFPENQVMDIEPFVIPRTALEGMLRVNPSLKEMDLHDSWAHFRANTGAIFSCRRMNNDFPAEAIRELFPVDEDLPEKPLEFPIGLKSALVQAEILSSEEGETSVPYVSIYSSPEGLVIEGKKELGEIQVVLEEGADLLEKGRIIKINPDFLGSILDVSRYFYIHEGKVIFLTEAFAHMIAIFSE